ncbi:uncharacterized protein LOC120766092 isoform X3 [Hirundo rustica]|uniref:uncharacterized protein LOC120766092 isoform X3 n=1 Tax=Hirundo rustica TaxID=43150 RepID=UPI002673835F|nr:uncharacterized protein LOC120766092 isoform X3 [Hirundo rustica]
MLILLYAAAPGMSQDRAPWPAPDRGTTQGGMSKTSPEGSLGPWPKFFWRASGLVLPAEGRLLQGRSRACSVPPAARSVPNTRPRDGRRAARTAPAQARLKGCPQLLGQGLLCTGTGRCFTPHGGHREPRGAPRSSWHCLGTGGSGHPQRGSDGDSRFPPPGAPPRLPVRRTRTPSHSGLTVPCSKSSAHAHRGKSSI